MGRAPPEQTDLLRFRQDCDAAILRSLDVNYVWVAADGTIFHILLIVPRRWIDGDYDFLAACIAGSIICMSEVTRVLEAIERGDALAANDLLPLVYDQLRREAQRHMADERSDHTLQATALVHEAYLRLVGDRRIP